jgi:hypothetical protein
MRYNSSCWDLALLELLIDSLKNKGIQCKHKIKWRNHTGIGGKKEGKNTFTTTLRGRKKKHIYVSGENNALEKKYGNLTHSQNGK